MNEDYTPLQQQYIDSVGDGWYHTLALSIIGSLEAQLAAANARADAALKTIQDGYDYCRDRKPARAGGIKWALDIIAQALEQKP